MRADAAAGDVEVLDHLGNWNWIGWVSALGASGVVMLVMVVVAGSVGAAVEGNVGLSLSRMHQTGLVHECSIDRHLNYFLFIHMYLLADIQPC